MSEVHIFEFVLEEICLVAFDAFCREHLRQAQTTHNRHKQEPNVDVFTVGNSSHLKREPVFEHWAYFLLFSVLLFLRDFFQLFVFFWLQWFLICELRKMLLH